MKFKPKCCDCKAEIALGEWLICPRCRKYACVICRESHDCGEGDNELILFVGGGPWDGRTSRILGGPEEMRVADALPGTKAVFPPAMACGFQTHSYRRFRWMWSDSTRQDFMMYEGTT